MTKIYNRGVSLSLFYLICQVQALMLNQKPIIPYFEVSGFLHSC